MAERVRECQVPDRLVSSEPTFSHAVDRALPDSSQRCPLFQTIAKSIEQYAHQLEAMFIDEMFPRKPEEALNQDVARPSAWLTKAKMVVQGDKKLEPFEFQPTVRGFEPKQMTRIDTSCIVHRAASSSTTSRRRDDCWTRSTARSTPTRFRALSRSMSRHHLPSPTLHLDDTCSPSRLPSARSLRRRAGTLERRSSTRS